MTHSIVAVVKRVLLIKLFLVTEIDLGVEYLAGAFQDGGQEGELLISGRQKQKRRRKILQNSLLKLLRTSETTTWRRDIGSAFRRYNQVSGIEAAKGCGT